MKPFQRRPILGEEVFVVIAVALLDLDTEFDTPAPPCPEVAAFVDVIVPQGMAGNPDMAGLFGDQFAAVGYPLKPGQLVISMG